MPLKIIFTEQQKKDIICLYKNLTPLKIISQKYEISVSFLIKSLKRWGVTLVGVKNKLTKDNEKEVCFDYQSGVPVLKICKKFSICQETVRQICLKNNLKTRKQIKSETVLENKEEILSRYNNGESFWKIAPDFGLCAQNLYDKLKDWNIDTYSSNNSQWKILEKHLDEIKHLYFSEKKTFKEISNIYDCWPADIQELFKKNNLKARKATGILQSGLERKFKENFLKDFNVKDQFKIEKRYFDFYLVDYNILIEVDGDYWHANPKFYKKKNLNEFQKESLKRDIIKNKIAETHNIKLIRFWEWDIWNNPDLIIEELRKATLGQPI